jgi:aspartyl-tRNA(Asn)/glutamyl-tRNA(Gln) amidotransferase subunit B
MIQKAIEYEYNRQSKLLNERQVFEQETRRRDDQEGKTITMRSKEDALDYRYMPDPDLPPLHILQDTLDRTADQTINIPADHIAVYSQQYRFNKEYINVLIGSAHINRYAQQLFQTSHDPAEIMKWIAGPIVAYLNEKEVDIDQLPFSQDDLITFLDAIADKTINDHQAKIIMKDMIQKGKSPSELITSHGFDSAGLSTDELANICQ